MKTIKLQEDHNDKNAATAKAGLQCNVYDLQFPSIGRVVSLGYKQVQPTRGSRETVKVGLSNFKLLKLKTE